MSRLCVLICRVEDEQQPDQLTQLQRIDLPALDPAQLQPATALDQLEATSLATGQQVMRHLLGQQWQQVDQQLAAELQRLSPPGDGES